MQRFGASLALAGGLTFVFVSSLLAQSPRQAPVLAVPATATPADALYLNGRLYTVDAHESVAEALAVRNGRIAYVGSNAGARALAG